MTDDITAVWVLIGIVAGLAVVLVKLIRDLS